MRWMRWCFPVILTTIFLSPASGAERIPLDERSGWFRHDRFGMFVHFGAYALIGKGEWVQDTGKIPLEEYIKYPPRFNPEKFDAGKWVGLAKRAGQKYIIITTKHHDGFCLFDSKLTDYTIMRTPFGRDLCRELADECRRQGIRIGFYYSIMDWHHPDYVPRRKWEKDRTTEGADFNRYVEYMRGQIRELMSNYGEICALWFDGGWEHKSQEDLDKFRQIIEMARDLQPRMLVNNRANIGGDYETPEQRIPATGVLDPQGKPAMWEVCMTMTTGHGSFAPTAWWGYDRDEKVFKPADELVQKLVDVTSKGGNFLLNVGPTELGEIRPEETDRLEAVGRWMGRHGEAIYGTVASPFRLLPFFGRVTRKGNRLFVHVFDWPTDRKIALPGLRDQPTSAFMMEQPGARVGAVCEQRNGADQLVLTLPADRTDPVASVVVLEFASEPRVEPFVLRSGSDGRIELPAAFAEIEAKHGQRAKASSESGRVYIGNWSNPNDVVVWNFNAPAEVACRAIIDGRPASPEADGQKVQLAIGDQKILGTITGGGVRVEGELKVTAGAQTLAVSLPGAKRTGPPILDLFGVRLVPAK